jgi:CRP-like cAMP-binding protein
MNQFIANKIPSAIIEKGAKKTFLKDSNIFKINSNITQCYLILSGIVKIYIDHENGRRSILDFVGCNDWLGELSLFCNEADIKENKVLHEVQCLAFDIDELRQLCKENAEISFYFASYTASKLLARSYRMSEYLNYSLEIRLASFILQHQHNGVYNIPHTDASEYMNVSYRHVLYVIKHFCELGILTKGKGYVISDADKLTQIKSK